MNKLILLFVSLCVCVHSLGQTSNEQVSGAPNMTNRWRGKIEADSGVFDGENRVLTTASPAGTIMKTDIQNWNTKGISNIPLQFTSVASQSTYKNDSLVAANVIGVTVAGVRISKTGFSFSDSTGIITFNSPLTSGQTVIIDYTNGLNVAQASLYYTKQDWDNIGIVRTTNHAIKQQYQPISKDSAFYSDHLTQTGFLSPIGVTPKPFNELVYSFLTRNLNPVTKIARAIRKGNNRLGAIIYSDTINISTNINTIYFDTIKLPFTYKGSDTLIFQFAADQTARQFVITSSLPFPHPPYALSQYQTTAGSLDLNFTGTLSINENQWFNLLYDSTYVVSKPNDTFSNEVSNNLHKTHTNVKYISSTSYTLDATDGVILVNTAANNCNVMLANMQPGDQIVIKKVSENNVLTITPLAGSIELRPLVSTDAMDSFTIVFDGVNYFII